MIDKGAFDERDYAEFAELQKGILSKFEPIREVTFKDEPFKYPDYNRDITPTQKQNTEKGVSKNMSDYIFKAFIVNRSEYDNGNKETSGAWLYFPTDTETVKKTFEEIGLPKNASPDKYFFDDYTCGNEDLGKCFNQYESVDALNYLAKRVSELEDAEMAVFQAAIKTEQCHNINDAINITYNIEYYKVIDNISDWADYGKYVAHRDRLYINTSKLKTNADFEKFGKEHADDHGGYLLDGIFLEFGWTEFNKVYDGIIEHIPDEYIVIGQGEPQTMTVVVVESLKEPYTKEIPEGLDALQKEVGGIIQVVYPFDEPIGLICNEEGKNEGLPLNRALYDEDGKIYDIIAGTFIIAGLTDENFGSLSDDLINKFSAKFKQPEAFFIHDGKIGVLPVETRKPSIKAQLDKMKKEQDSKNQPKPPQKKPPEEMR